MNQYRTREGDTVDDVAFRHYGTLAGRAVEQVLDANPGLADHGPLLPANLLLTLPDLQVVEEQTAGARLWD